MNKDEHVYCTRCEHLVYALDGVPHCSHEHECNIWDPEDSKPFRDRPFYYEKRNTATTIKDDIRTLYLAFVKLCDYVEQKTANGCTECPLHDICFSRESAYSGENFAKTLGRIREQYDIPFPYTSENNLKNTEEEN